MLWRENNEIPLSFGDQIIIKRYFDESKKIGFFLPTIHQISVFLSLPCVFLFFLFFNDSSLQRWKFVRTYEFFFANSERGQREGMNQALLIIFLRQLFVVYFYFFHSELFTSKRKTASHYDFAKKQTKFLTSVMIGLPCDIKSLFRKRENCKNCKLSLPFFTLFFFTFLIFFFFYIYIYIYIMILFHSVSQKYY